jgi:hypothetical protein
MSEQGSETLASLEPFVIRAHHTELLLSVIGGRAPNLQAERVRRASRDNRYDRWLPHGYYADVYGLDRATGEAVTKGDEQFFADFMALPEDAPVKLVVDQKDGICQTCAVGDHCTLKEGRFNSANTGDTSYLRAFEKGARLLGRGNEVTKVWDTAEYSNGKPRRVPGLLTNVDCLKQVITNYRYLGLKERALPTRLAGAMADAVTPENFNRTHPKLRNKLSAIRPLAAVALLLVGAKGVNDAGELRQLHADSRIVQSHYVHARLEKRITHEENQVAEDAGKLLVGSLVYLIIPRRRKARAPLKTRSKHVISS